MKTIQKAIKKDGFRNNVVNKSRTIGARNGRWIWKKWKLWDMSRWSMT